MEIVRDFILGGSKITVNGDCCHEIKRHLLLGSKAMTNLDSKLNSRDKGPSGQSYGFSSSHIWMWELDSKESWSLKNWCFWAVVLKTLESVLDCKEIQPVHHKGDQSWIFIGRTDAEAETPIFDHLMRRTYSLEKTLMLENIEDRRRWDDREWDGWMAIPTQWKRVWINSRIWWLTGRPAMLQRVGLDCLIQLNWIVKWVSRSVLSDSLQPHGL